MNSIGIKVDFVTSSSASLPASSAPENNHHVSSRTSISSTLFQVDLVKVALLLLLLFVSLSAHCEARPSKRSFGSSSISVDKRHQVSKKKRAKEGKVPL